MIVILGITFFCYFNISYKYSLESELSPIGGVFNTEFTILSLLVQVTLYLSIISLTILVSGVRYRQIKNRILEVVESQPLSNFQLLIGQTLGAIIVILFLFTLCFVILGVVGFFLERSGWGLWAGSFSFPYWMKLTILDFVPTVIVWTGIISLITTVFRFRAIVLFLISALVIITYLLVQHAPMAIGTYVGSVGMHSISLPSSILTEPIQLGIVLNRIGLMGLGLVLVFLAACAMKRSQPKLTLGSGACCLFVAVLGTSCVSFPLVLESFTHQQHQDWEDAHHSAYSTSDGDLVSVWGDVEIDPGKRLLLDITLQVQLTETYIQDQITFSFNPGMQIKKLSVNGQEATFKFENGLLEVEKTQVESSRAHLLIHLQAEGIPDDGFAYLDEAIELQREWHVSSILTRSLGHKSSIFHSNYVALMPATKWLPSLGVAVHEDLTEDHPRDFFDVDLTVAVPNSWTIAAPDKTLLRSDHQKRHFTVSPKVPLSNVTLIASEFATRGFDVDGVNVELLLHKNHEHQLDYLTEFVSEVQSLLQELFSYLNRNGASYPLTVLSLVEIPSSLRTYGGGWKMRSVLSGPGLVMLRELSLPTVKLRQYLDSFMHYLDEDQHSKFVVAVLGSFFSNDRLGGNIFREGARNLVENWTRPTGSGSSAINCIVDELALGSLTVDRYIPQPVEPSFSVFNVRHKTIQGFVQNQVLVPSRYRLSDQYSDLANQLFENSPNSWQVLQTSLASLDFKQDPEVSSKILRLKCAAISNMLFESLGRSTITEFIGELRRRHGGRSYTLDDIVEISRDLGIPELSYLADWIEKPDLPGYLIKPESIVRVSDQHGDEHYETSLLVRNDQNIVGAISLNLTQGESGMHFFSYSSSSPAYFIPANTTHRFRLLSRYPPSAVRISTFLSLNQGTLFVVLPPSEESGHVYEMGNEIEVVNDEWETLDGIVVDDLDDQFKLQEVERGSENGLFDFLSFTRHHQRAIDFGLPRYIENDLLPPTWSRVKLEGAFGKYRRTAAIGVAGYREILASFTSSLPENGKWQLDFHLPVNPNVVKHLNSRVHNWITSGRLARTMHKQGVYGIRIVQSDETMAVEFDASNGSLGWNPLGTFDLEDTKVEVQLSNKSDGSIVYADAIRWSKEPN